MPRRSPSRRTVVPLGAIAVVLALLGAVYACQSNGVDATDTPPTVAGQNPTPTWYQLYFTDPDTTSNLDNPTGGIPDKVAASFATAQKTLDLAVYEFDLPVLSDALVVRGWQVRHILPAGDLEDHRLTPFAVVEGILITYPPAQTSLDL